MNHIELKQLRRKLDISQAEMAKKLGISLATYGLYERGKPMHKPVELLAMTMREGMEQA